MEEKIKRSNKIKRSAGEWVFDTCNVIFMLLIMFITLYPFWYVTVCSFSNPMSVDAGMIFWWPDAFQTGSYEEVFAIDYFWNSYLNTIILSVGGTVVSLIATMLSAYPLSKKRLWGRKFFTLAMIVTMYFAAGMIPRFLIFKAVGVMNNLFMYMLAFCMTPFYIILMRTYFQSISESLEESAKLDGASDWKVLVKIYVPLSVPAIMTIGLYYFVGRWNSYFWEMILLRDADKVPLQVLLRKLIVEQQAQGELAGEDGTVTKSQQTIIYATIVVAALPMLIIYPFIQKFFVKGIMVGAVKG